MRTQMGLPSRACSYGALVTRLQSIEEMAGMNMLCSDKTGAHALLCRQGSCSAGWHVGLAGRQAGRRDG